MAQYWLYLKTQVCSLKDHQAFPITVKCFVVVLPRMCSRCHDTCWQCVMGELQSLSQWSPGCPGELELATPKGHEGNQLRQIVLVCVFAGAKSALLWSLNSTHACDSKLKTAVVYSIALRSLLFAVYFAKFSSVIFPWLYLPIDKRKQTRFPKSLSRLRLQVLQSRGIPGHP